MATSRKPGPSLAAAAAALLLALAGCLGGSDADASTTPATSPTSAAGGPVPGPSTGPATPNGPPPTSDTLHLLRAPGVSLQPGNLSDPTSSPVPYGRFDDGGGAVWEHTLARHANLTAARAHVVLRVIEDILSPPEGSPLCAFSLTIALYDGSAAYESAPSCFGTGPLVGPGDYPFDVTVDLAGAPALTPGARVEARIQRDAFSPTPNQAVYVLGGSADADSLVQLDGLAEPVP